MTTKQTGPTMGCAAVREAIAAGEPIPAPGSPLAAHLDGCEQCRAFAGDVRELRALARALPRPEAPLVSRQAAAGPTPRRWVPLGVALGAAVVVALALGWALLAGEREETQAPRRPTPPAERLDLLACLDEAAEVWGGEDWSVQEWLRLPGEPQPLFAEQKLLRRLHRSSLLDTLLDGSEKGGGTTNKNRRKQ